jgi:UDP-glucose 4-epimerase
VLALKALNERGRMIYNLGNGTGFSVRQVIAAAAEVTGCSIPTVEGARRAGDPAVLVASSERIRAELGWAAVCPQLHDIVRSAWVWHQQHAKGYATGK